MAVHFVAMTIPSGPVHPGDLVLRALLNELCLAFVVLSRLTNKLNSTLLKLCMNLARLLFVLFFVMGGCNSISRRFIAGSVRMASIMMETVLRL